MSAGFDGREAENDFRTYVAQYRQHLEDIRAHLAGGRSLRDYEEVDATDHVDESEGIELANACKYGLGAGIWTSELSRAHRVAAEIEAGLVWVNTHHRNDPSSPWCVRCLVVHSFTAYVLVQGRYEAEWHR